MKEILMVSAPLGPPWNNSPKNLVHGIVRHAGRFGYHVLTAGDFMIEHPLVRCIPAPAFSFQPTLGQKLRVAWTLRRHPDPIVLGNSFFRPNRTTQRFFNLLRRRPFVQTITCLPDPPEALPRLLFGEHVVVLSRWAERLCGRPCRRIPPGIEMTEPADPAPVVERMGLGADPVILYAGDYAECGDLVEALPKIWRAIPEAWAIFACRRKRRSDDDVRRRLESTPGRLRVVGETQELDALLAAAWVHVFAPRSLSGKMDLPMVLLETLRAGTPAIVSSLEPLRELGVEPVVRAVPPADPDGLAQAVVASLRCSERGALRLEARRAAARFDIRTVAAEYEALYDEILS
jgi:glycosyltransferase involved in cell wall biosynthesis